MCHLQEQVDLLSKVELSALADPGHSTHNDTLECTCPGEGWWLWLSAQSMAPVLAAVVLLGRLWLAQPLPSEECTYLVLPSTRSCQNPNFGGTRPRGPKYSHCDNPRKGCFVQPNR